LLFALWPTHADRRENRHFDLLASVPSFGRTHRHPLLESCMASRLITLAVLALLTGCASHATKLPDGVRAKVAILETTDVHSNVLSYDYYKLKPDSTLGYERTATLIRRARAEFPNTFLFDSGDTIQGSVLADYQALVKPIACDQELAIYRAMDAIGYDGGTAGNHEFNYGLRFLSQATGTPMNVDGGRADRCAGPHFPLVLANVDSARCRSLAMPLTKTPGSGAAAMALRSPPALKNFPAPVRVTTFVASLSQSAAAAASSRVKTSFMPLAASGRSRVIPTMAPDRLNVSVSKSTMTQNVAHRSGRGGPRAH